MSEKTQGESGNRELDARGISGPVVVIRQEYMAITGGCPVAAALLGFFEYQAATVASERDGWYYQDIAGLVEKLLYMASERAVRRALAYLVGTGLIERRANPTNKWDRTYQYRVDVDAVQMMIDAYLDGVEMDVSSDAECSYRELQNESLDPAHCEHRDRQDAAIETDRASSTYTRLPLQESDLPESLSISPQQAALRAEVVAPLEGSHPLWKLLEDQHDIIEEYNRQYTARGINQRESWEDPAALALMEAQFGKVAVNEALTITRSRKDVRNPIAYVRGVVVRRQGAEVRR